MTVLTVCQEAAIELNQTEPSSLFSSTDQFAKELRTQANKAAKAIAKANDWRALMTLNTLTGDGTTTSFALPSNYDRMPKAAALLNGTTPVNAAHDLDAWQYLNANPSTGGYSNWILLGGAMQIAPALASASSTTFYYIRNTIVAAQDLSLKEAFTADTDTFVLSEKLLGLAIVWRWRAQKRKDYAEDMRNYEIALSEEIGADKGPGIITVGQQRHGLDVHPSYPWPLGA